MKNLKFDGTNNNFKKTKSGISQRELKLALKEGTECSWGIDPILGLLVLPDYNSVSGDVDRTVGVYIADGAVVIEPIATATQKIKGYCSNKFVSATGVTITGCVVGALEALATRQLTAVVTPTGALQTGTWVSSDPTKATVSSTGLVTGVAAGSTTITFTSTDGGLTANCDVIVG